MNKYIWHIAAIIFAIAMVNVPFAMTPWLTDSGPTWLGLDVSWQMTLNYAWNRKMIFGKEIVYTYGPLGFLCTRIGWGISFFTFLCFDLIVVTNFYFIFKDFITQSVNKVAALLLIFFILISFCTYHQSNLAWVLLVFIYYWLYRHYKNPKTAYIFIAAFLSILAFYIKLNTGLIGIALLSSHIILMLVFKRINAVRVVLSFAILLSLLILSILYFKIPIIDYVKNALDIMKGYNDMMHMYDGHRDKEMKIVWLFFLISILYLIHAALLFKNKNYHGVFFALINILFLFLLRKQATFRGDTQHLSEFFYCAPLVFIWGNSMLGNIKIQKAALFTSLGLNILIFYANSDVRSFKDAGLQRLFVFKDYKNSIQSFGETKYVDQPGKRFIPQRALKEIGTNTIDVFPWDCEYMLENKLNYAPRPIFQSFSVFTKNLEKINYDYYVNKPPEFILYDYDAINGSYPFNDEPLVYHYILNNYVISDTFISNERWRILLRKKKNTSSLLISKITEQEIAIGDEIIVDKAVLMQINIRYSFLGKLYSIWNRPRTVSIKYYLADGTSVIYRTSTEQLKSGIKVDRYVSSNRDFANMFSSGSLLKILKVQLLVEDRFFDKKTSVVSLDVR